MLEKMPRARNHLLDPSRASRRLVEVRVGVGHQEYARDRAADAVRGWPAARRNDQLYHLLKDAHACRLVDVQSGVRLVLDDVAQVGHPARQRDAHEVKLADVADAAGGVVCAREVEELRAAHQSLQQNAVHHELRQPHERLVLLPDVFNRWHLRAFPAAACPRRA
eukprot:CAMPEP_0170136420 /NCGR_PEP_ID=MMETSP0033_2-20121228/3290_1 /TAXON_ID=195969 /ORGANISM="Dolichomastix tenuilepis, Strain CCMP3274" /LENGTH=164 /DNA_ID=CAMNT_0010372133 /DNA_START=364 /DNA_END=854 /DNA_ORIENTATION=+